MCYHIIQKCSVYVSFPPQADGEPKELKGMPALMHMINDIKEKHANKEKIGLHDLDTIMPYKCIMSDTDRNELGAIARNAISELGSMAREGSSAAGSSNDKGEQPSDKKESVVFNFFG